MKTITNYENLRTVQGFAKEKDITRQTAYNWIRNGRVKTVDYLGKRWVDISTFKDE